MNSLSWMIYFAEMAGDFNIVCGILLFAGGGVLALAAIVLSIEDPEMVQKMLKWPAIAWLVVAALVVVVPSNNTIYAIAASEMGEDVLNSETGSKAIKALDAWLDRQIGDEE